MYLQSSFSFASKAYLQFLQFEMNSPVLFSQLYMCACGCGREAFNFPNSFLSFSIFSGVNSLYSSLIFSNSDLLNCLLAKQFSFNLSPKQAMQFVQPVQSSMNVQSCEPLQFFK